MNIPEPFAVSSGVSDGTSDASSSQEAELMPVIEDEVAGTTPSRLESDGQHNSWLRRAAGGVFGFFASALTAQTVVPPANNPRSLTRNSPTVMSSSGDWELRGHYTLPFTEETTTSALPILAPQDIQFDLREAVLQYKRTPNDRDMNIILAALHYGDFQVNGDVLSAAHGHRQLMTVFLRSGKVNLDDPEVQWVVQEEINSLLTDDLSRGRIAPEKFAYLTLLCRVPSASLTKEQAQLCRQAGFEFSKVLYDNPHILRNIPPPNWIVARILSICYASTMVITWLGLAAILLNVVSLSWLTAHWFKSENASFGYWTILCYVVGYVGSIVVVMLSEEGRIREYEDRLWDYPDNSLKAIPCIPIFEIALMYVALRYELRRDKAKYFVIRHDLYNGLSNVLIIHAFSFGIPQLLVQFFLASLYSPETKTSAPYILLITVDYTLYGISISLFIWNVLFQYSCNNFGFAVMAAKKAIFMPTDITTRILIISIIFNLECDFIACIITLSDLGACSLGTIVFISIAVSWTVLEVIGLVLLILFEVTQFLWVVCLSAVLLQVAFSIYSVAGIPESSHGDICTLLAISTPIVPPFTYLAFGFLCIAFILWVVVVLHDRLTGRQLLHWDAYFYWSQGG